MFVDQISKRDAAAVPEAFPRVFLQAALCVARKIRGVVLCKSFEQRFEEFVQICTLESKRETPFFLRRVLYTAVSYLSRLKRSRFHIISASNR